MHHLYPPLLTTICILCLTQENTFAPPSLANILINYSKNFEHMADFPKHFLLAGPFWLQEITKHPHTLKYGVSK